MALRGLVDKAARNCYNNYLKPKLLWFPTTVINDRNLSSRHSSNPLPAAKPPRRADFDAILHSIPKHFIKYSAQVDASQNANLEFLRVLKANKEHLFGLRYYITLEAINAGVKNTYQAKILLNAEKCVWDLELFGLADDNPSNRDVKKQGFLENFKGQSWLHENVVPRFLGNLGMKLGVMKVKENVSPPCALSFRSFIHSASPKVSETGRNINRSMNYVRGIMEENGRAIMRGSQPRYGVEQNADIVHIKLIRNNAFVTVTDSKGNKKVGASTGSVPEMKGGTKVSRYAAEATAEHVGRLAKEMGLKSVVMKVNGFTYFKKKKQAILSFREGYTNSRADQNPIVYVEDTTRRPHNGCRLRKKRRV